MSEAKPQGKDADVRQSTVRRPFIRLEDLLKGGKEVAIEYQGKEYLLRVTRSGKLLLTK